VNSTQEAISAQPRSIIEAVIAVFEFFDRVGMPPLCPDKIVVMYSVNKGKGCICIYPMSFDHVKAEIATSPGTLEQARTELLERLAEGATEGAIVWAQDSERNNFVLPVGRMVFSGINSRGGSA
jgi:hypothetical protein